MDNNKKQELYNQQIEVIKSYMKENEPNVIISDKHTDELLMNFLHNKAKDYKVGKVAMCKDDLVFGWCVEFYKSEIKEQPKKKTQKTNTDTKNKEDKFIEEQKEKVKADTPKTKLKGVEQPTAEQLDLLSFLEG